MVQITGTSMSSRDGGSPVRFPMIMVKLLQGAYPYET